MRALFLCAISFVKPLSAFLALMAFAAQLSAAPMRVVDGSDGIAAYAKGVLKIVLSKLPEKYEWDDSTPSATEARVTQMLNDGELDIVWYATTNDFEEKMLPIRIPLYKGLLGYRIFMIRKGNQHLFDGIETLGDLNRVSIGQGRLWADTNIMEANGIDVVKATQYEGLFYMLDGGRFEAFPRGVHEPWYEIARYPDLDLAVEKTLMMSYTNPFYFFVAKGNTQLAKKIEKGFREAIEDGSFDDYFFNDPVVKDVIEKANLQDRTVIKLENPLLPKNTPVDDAPLWLDPRAL
ncbi:substrate-binding periplasmic protein [Teredinibacter haidensis]|uniref:substrate-binding periplasmic protein n=1 Tax=Teredinibacter haidensis TaxID=2731755 RepID=UPI000AFA772D|nr:transporter substrate-binding domain-containing protein [Teredinibacter haidensis]